MIKKQKEHIVISKELKDELDKLGNKGDTYESIIRRLLKNGKNNFIAELKILAKKEAINELEKQFTREGDLESLEILRENKK